MPRTFTVKQAAKLLGLTPLTIRRWVLSGRLPDRRIPGARKHVFFMEDLFPSLPTTQAA